MIDRFTFLKKSINYVVLNLPVVYSDNMTKHKPKELNTFEKKLKDDLEERFKAKEVSFSVFINELREDMPTGTEKPKFDDYKNKYKAERLKLLRASFSYDEVRKMLDIIGYRIVFTVAEKTITPAKTVLKDMKVRYTDVMAVCELLGIEIDWVEK